MPLARTEPDLRLAQSVQRGTHWGPILPMRLCLRLLGLGRVAQLDRALPSGGRGRGFESLRVRQEFREIVVSISGPIRAVPQSVPVVPQNVVRREM